MASQTLVEKRRGNNFFKNFGTAFAKGDVFTKISFFIWGLGFIGHGQLMKALLVTLVQGLGLYFLAMFGIPNLKKFDTLGTVQMESVFDFKTMKNIVNDYDNSFEILLLGVIAILVILSLLAASMAVVRRNYQLQRVRESGKKVNSFRDDIKVYLNEKFYITLLTLPVLGVVIFTIVPLIILIAVAFTNYDQQHMPPANLFTWVGMNNFVTLFSTGVTQTFGYSFGKVLRWTLVWAVFATVTTFFGGIFLAQFINNKRTRAKKLWRTIFVVTIAVPQFVTLLLVRNFFSNSGIMNTMMANWGVTDFLKNIGLVHPSLKHIPFLTDPNWAKFTIIMINIWIGVPYQMLIATGILMNIPSDMIEAARIDGASPRQTFRRIKLPYIFAVQGPALVTDFIRNINNFNVIYLLTQDVFVTQDQKLAMSQAKEVDLLITWLFRLTQEYYNYKMAAVIGIMIFIISVIFTVVAFHYVNRKEGIFS